MHFHTGNVYFGVVLNAHVPIFVNKKQIKNEETTPSIRFHIYHSIARCTTYGRTPLKDNKICYMCKQESLPDKYTKIYTRKEIVIMEKNIYVLFHQTFYFEHFRFHISIFPIPITTV